MPRLALGPAARLAAALATAFATMLPDATAAAPPPGKTLKPPLRFTDVTAAAGILAAPQVSGMAIGLAAADYDDDGDVDLFLPTAAGAADRLWRNRGDGTFEEIAAGVGLAATAASRVALWFDYDGDQDLDLLVANDDAQETTSFRLHAQAAGQFSDVTAAAGLHVQANAIMPHRGGLAAGDLDNDGFLDLYAAMWGGESHLFMNQGNGTFLDRSVASGVRTTYPQHEWQPMMADFDGDGWQDISVAVDFAPNRLWINQHDGTFQDAAPAAGAANAMNDMGQYLADVDDDGDLDIYITNIIEHGRNILLRNDSSPPALAFAEVSRTLGVDRGGWGWGATIFDADLDGRPEIAATNGFSYAPWTTDRSCFFVARRDGPLRFTDGAVAVGFDDRRWGSALVALDYDRDGDPDLAQACMDGTLALLRNDPPPFAEPALGGGAAARHFLVIKPRMNGPNHRAIGALVRVRTGAVTRTRLISAGTSLLAQEPAEACFGLGGAAVADEVRVEFPDGQTRVLANVAADQWLTLYP